MKRTMKRPDREFALKFLSKDETRYTFTLVGHKGKFYYVCDEHRLVRMEAPEAPEGGQYLLPDQWAMGHDVVSPDHYTGQKVTDYESIIPKSYTKTLTLTLPTWCAKIGKSRQVPGVCVYDDGTISLGLETIKPGLAFGMDLKVISPLADGEVYKVSYTDSKGPVKVDHPHGLCIFMPLRVSDKYKV